MRLIIVSNRLPVTVALKNGKPVIQTGSGGLASGMASLVDKLKKSVGGEISEYLWIGWPGSVMPEDGPLPAIVKSLSKQSLFPVFLSSEQVENFYNGFANDTLWPLFHSFPDLVTYSQNYWKFYREVNELFSNEVAKHYRAGDLIWIHDYHLMLMPKMLREKLGSSAAIGFFLHIPFPSFEIFRLLPERWRKTLLLGPLGADVVGFHTHDYAFHFTASARRILGCESNLREIIMENHLMRM